MQEVLLSYTHNLLSKKKSAIHITCLVIFVRVWKESFIDSICGEENELRKPCMCDRVDNFILIDKVKRQRLLCLAS